PTPAPAAAAPAGTATVSVSAQDGASKSPRSEIVRIDANGAVESLWSFTEDTVYSLAWHRGRLWVGTGLEGRLFSYNAASAKMVLEKDADERQIMALLSDGERLTLATTNAAAIYRSAGELERQGTYTSPDPDAPGPGDGQTKQLWKKGYRTLRWEAADPNDDKLQYTLEFRRESDPAVWLPMAKDLDETWYSFDETALPDGLYRFRLRASDRKQNEVSPLEAEQVTEPVLVADGAPRVTSVAW